MLRIELISNEALKTSEIEGEILDRDECTIVGSRQQFGLATDQRHIPPAEHGIAEMMADLYRGFAERRSARKPCLPGTLCHGGTARGTFKSSAATAPIPSRCVLSPGFCPQSEDSFRSPALPRMKQEMAGLCRLVRRHRGQMASARFPALIPRRNRTSLFCLHSSL